MDFCIKTLIYLERAVFLAPLAWQKPNWLVGIEEDAPANTENLNAEFPFGAPDDNEQPWGTAIDVGWRR